MLRTLTAAALLGAPAAMAAPVTFDDALVVVVASGAVTASFSAANGNLPDVDRVSIDQNTSDYGFPGQAQGLLSFADFSIPAGASVASASLEFFTKSFTDGPVNIHRLLNPFDTTTSFSTLGGNGITLGVDAVATAAASQSDIADEAPVAFDVTSIVASWALGNPANGFALLNTSGDGWDFQVVTDGAEFSPRLTVDFTTGVAPIPLPAGAWLLLTAAGALVAAGRARRA